MPKIICDPEQKHCGAWPGYVLNTKVSKSAEFIGYASKGRILPRWDDHGAFYRVMIDGAWIADFNKSKTAKEYLEFKNVELVEA